MRGVLKHPELHARYATEFNLVLLPTQKSPDLDFYAVIPLCSIHNCVQYMCILVLVAVASVKFTAFVWKLSQKINCQCAEGFALLRFHYHSNYAFLMTN